MHASVSAQVPQSNLLHFIRETAMNHLLRVLILVVVPAVAVTGWMQTTDLSGVWTLDVGSDPPPPPAPPPAPPPSPHTPPPPPPPPQQIALTIAQTATAFRITRTMRSGDSTTERRSTYRLDGSETTDQTGPILNTTTASWNGDTLVLHTVFSASRAAVDSGRPLGHLREAFSLQDGRLVVESARRVPAGDSTGRLVYVRVR
jgi:hypothetical protein